MTENQKAAALAGLEERAAAAEVRGLRCTARSWREYAANMAVRPAAEMVLSRVGWTDEGRHGHDA